MSDEPLHGGRLWAVARELGVEPSSLVDFSANLNPLGPPATVAAAIREALPAALAVYPDSEAPALRRLLCARYGASDPSLVLGNGGAALLLLALRALSPRRMLVPEPCFREQPRALAAVGVELVPFAMRDLHLDLEALAGALGGCDGLLLTNPHNPTGQILPRAALQPWVERHPDVCLVVDEAFMDYAPSESLVSVLVDRPRTVVLRSLTKFFAMPGLRVGYAFADPRTAARMRELQESWPVGQLELLAARAAFGDREFEAQSLAAFRADATRFRDALRVLVGLSVVPGAGPFVLVRLHAPCATRIAAALLAQGLIVRTGAEWPGLGDAYLRLAVRRPADQDRLLAALATSLRDDTARP